MKLLECCLQTADNNFISSALKHLYIQYRFCPGISRFKPWWLGQDKTWKHLKAANFLYKTSWMCPREFLPGISTVIQTPIKQSKSAATTWEFSLGPFGCNSHQQQEPKEFFQYISYLFIHLTRKIQRYLKAYLVKRETQKLQISLSKISSFFNITNQFATWVLLWLHAALSYIDYIERTAGSCWYENAVYILPNYQTFQP